MITTLHGTDITLVGQESSFYAITKFSIEQSDAVTAVSAYLRDETYRAFGCVSCDLKVIPNFVNLQEYQPGDAGDAAQASRPRATSCITHVSNFREVKRVKDVVRVFARIQRAMPATLIMIGDGPERVDAENEARELGVGGGRPVPRPARLGGVAAAGQRPVPAAVPDRVVRPRGAGGDGLRRRRSSRAGPAGCPRWWTTASNGILEPVGSVEAMGRRAVELLRDRERHAAMREAAIAKAREFSADRIVPMYEALYQEVLR